MKENNVKVAIRSDITRRGKRKIVILGRTDLLDAERKCSKKLPSVIIIGRFASIHLTMCEATDTYYS